LSPGQLCQITFDGKDVLEKGTFKGKEVNRFALALPEGAEVGIYKEVEEEAVTPTEAVNLDGLD